MKQIAVVGSTSRNDRCDQKRINYVCGFDWRSGDNTTIVIHRNSTCQRDCPKWLFWKDDRSWYWRLRTGKYIGGRRCRERRNAGKTNDTSLGRNRSKTSDYENEGPCQEY